MEEVQVAVRWVHDASWKVLPADGADGVAQVDVRQLHVRLLHHLLHEDHLGEKEQQKEHLSISYF